MPIFSAPEQKEQAESTPAPAEAKVEKPVPQPKPAKPVMKPHLKPTEVEQDPINPDRQDLPAEPEPKPEVVPQPEKKVAEPEEHKFDDSAIGAASNDEMFAFSQVIAQGGSIQKTVDNLEKEAATEKQSELDIQKEDMLKA